MSRALTRAVWTGHPKAAHARYASSIATSERPPIRLLLLGAPVGGSFVSCSAAALIPISYAVDQQGAGKGTHAGNLVKKYKLDMIVAGDILRNEVNRGTQLGKQMKEIMKSGKLLSDDLIWRMIEPVILEHQHRNFVLDGFPRTAIQAQRLDKYLSVVGQHLDLVINLEVPDQVILERIEGRWIHLPSQRQYNTTFNPPKVPGRDDVTGEPLSKRVDDDAKTFKVRLDAFHKANTPLLEHYRNDKSRPDRLVTVSGPTSKIVWPQIEKIMNERFPHIRHSLP